MTNEESWRTRIIDSPAVRASLVLRGFGDDPGIVTTILNRTPARSGRAGDPLASPTGRTTNKAVRTTYWALHSRLGAEEPLGRHVADILEQVGESRHAFIRLPKNTQVTLRCTVIPEDALPLLRIESEQLAILGQVGAALEIDVVSVDGPPPESRDTG
jgi:hypothetical protein